MKNLEKLLYHIFYTRGELGRELRTVKKKNKGPHANESIWLPAFSSNAFNNEKRQKMNGEAGQTDAMTECNPGRIRYFPDREFLVMIVFLRWA